MNYEKKVRAGFTLIELLIVIAIIGVLASIVVVSLTGNTDNANESVARSNLSTVNRLFTKLGYEQGGIKQEFCTGTDPESVGVQDIVSVSLAESDDVGGGKAPIDGTTDKVDGYVDDDVGNTDTPADSTAGCLSMADKWVVWVTMGGVTYCIDNTSNIAKEITLGSTVFNTLTSTSCDDVDNV